MRAIAQPAGNAQPVGDARPRGEKPALIPLPQSLEWTSGSFSLDRCKSIVINDPRLREEAARWLKMTGSDIPVKYSATGIPSIHARKPVIRLTIGEVNADRKSTRLNSSP